MKLSFALAAALFSFSALSFTARFEGTVDLTKNAPHFSYPSPYMGKVNVEMILSAETLELAHAAAEKAYWGDFDVHEEDAYYCVTSMTFTPVTATFKVTDEVGNLQFQATRTDAPKAISSYQIDRNDECQVTIPKVVSLELKGFYQNYLQVNLSGKVLDLMPVVLNVKGTLNEGTVTELNFGTQQLQWFLTPGMTVGNTVDLILK